MELLPRQQRYDDDDNFWVIRWLTKGQAGETALEKCNDGGRVRSESFQSFHYLQLLWWIICEQAPKERKNKNKRRSQWRNRNRQNVDSCVLRVPYCVDSKPLTNMTQGIQFRCFIDLFCWTISAKTMSGIKGKSIACLWSARRNAQWEITHKWEKQKQ